MKSVSLAQSDSASNSNLLSCDLTISTSFRHCSRVSGIFHVFPAEAREDEDFRLPGEKKKAAPAAAQARAEGEESGSAESDSESSSGSDGEERGE